MKKIYKWLVTALLSVSLFFGNSITCSEANATGFPTIDISNLVQNILGFLEDQMREGSFLDLVENGITKIEDVQERYKAFQEKMQTFRVALSYIKGANQFVHDIELLIALGEQVGKDVKDFDDLEFYFNYESDVVTTLNTTINIAHSYQQILDILMKVGRNRIDAYNNMTQSDPMELLNYFHETIEEIYVNYFRIRRIYMRRYVNYYRDYAINRVISDTGKLINRWFF